MSVRMSATFQYVDQVGCACSAPSAACSTCSTRGCESCAGSCAMVGVLLDEVDEREDHDPDDVDEVPVQRGQVDVDGVPWSEATPVIDREQGQKPEHARSHVRAVKPGQGEERAAEQVRANRQSLVHERGELECLEAEEHGA